VVFGGWAIDTISSIGWVRARILYVVRAVALCVLGWVLVFSVCHARVKQGTNGEHRVLPRGVECSSALRAWSSLSPFAGYLIETRRL